MLLHQVYAPLICGLWLLVALLIAHGLRALVWAHTSPRIVHVAAVLASVGVAWLYVFSRHEPNYDWWFVVGILPLALNSLALAWRVRPRAAHDSHEHAPATASEELTKRWLPVLLAADDPVDWECPDSFDLN